MNETVLNKINAILAMGVSAEEIGAIAKEAEAAKAEAHAKILKTARENVKAAFNAYNKVLNYPECPDEIWEMVLDSYENDELQGELNTVTNDLQAEIDELINALFAPIDKEEDKKKEDSLSELLKKYIN